MPRDLRLLQRNSQTEGLTDCCNGGEERGARAQPCYPRTLALEGRTERASILDPCVLSTRPRSGGGGGKGGVGGQEERESTRPFSRSCLQLHTGETELSASLPQRPPPCRRGRSPHLCTGARDTPLYPHSPIPSPPALRMDKDRDPCSAMY